MSWLSRLAERQIQKARLKGQLQGLEGEGKPLPDRTGDAFVSAGDAVGFRIMAQAGVLPEEITLKKQVAEQTALLATLTDEARGASSCAIDGPYDFSAKNPAPTRADPDFSQKNRWVRPRPPCAARRGGQTAAMTGPRYTDLAASLPATVPFVGPEAQERARGRAFRARLGANESLFGPSPRAIAAMRAAAAEAWMYGDPEVHDLRAAIAAHHGVTPAHVVVGEGIDGLLGLLVRLLVGAGDAVVTSLGAYPTFAFHVAGFGGTLHRVPYLGDHEDPQALLAKARETGAKLIYFANPDNPMGSWHPAATVQAMIDALPDGCLLLLDEAYADLAPVGTVPQIAADDPRVIRMRTFSKGYGLAGLRVGYAIAAPDLIRAFDKVRNHFGMGRIAQAGALAALADQDWLEQVKARVAGARDQIAAIARDNGLVPLPSATNFVSIDCGRDGDFARAVLGALVARDVFVRMPGVAPLDRCIRVSVGGPQELAILAEALPQALSAARG